MPPREPDAFDMEHWSWWKSGLRGSLFDAEAVQLLSKGQNQYVGVVIASPIHWEYGEPPPESPLGVLTAEVKMGVEDKRTTRAACVLKTLKTATYARKAPAASEPAACVRRNKFCTWFPPVGVTPRCVCARPLARYEPSCMVLRVRRLWRCWEHLDAKDKCSSAGGASPRDE